MTETKREIQIMELLTRKDYQYIIKLICYCIDYSKAENPVIYVVTELADKSLFQDIQNRRLMQR
jgi:hypothetical protein